MIWSRRRQQPAPPPAAALAAVEGQRLLAAGDAGSAWLLATPARFVAVRPDGEVLWDRPWHEVDQAVWGRQASELTVIFVDGGRPVVLPLGFEERFLQVLRERVQASVVTADDLPLPGARRARAVIRKDLASGELVEQVVLGRGTRPSQQIDVLAVEVFDRLREEVGLPPR